MGKEIAKTQPVDHIQKEGKEALVWICGTEARSAYFVAELLKVTGSPDEALNYLLTSWLAVKQDLEEGRSAAKRQNREYQVDQTTYDTRCTCFLLGAKSRLPIGGFHGYWSLTPYGTSLTLDLGWRGCLAIVKRNDPSIVNIDVILIYQGDEVILENRESGDMYTVKRADPFNDKQLENLRGALAVFTFKDKPVRVYTRGKAWADETRNKAKNQSIWKGGFGERMMVKSVVKSVAQPFMAGSEEFKVLADYDNRLHFELKQGDAEPPKQTSVQERMLDALEETPCEESAREADAR